MSSSHDPFDDILNLEEQYYKEGYEEGLKDGGEAGRIEGYSLGLTKGFEKFLEAGRLQSKAMVWANRIPKYQERRQRRGADSKQSGTSEPDVESTGGKREDIKTASENEARLPLIHSNARLEKNIEVLYGLVEPGTLSMNNDDEAVNDFDSRIKGAHGKLRIIERALGETTTSHNVTGLLAPTGKNENIEDIGNIQPQVGARSIEG
ncbi:DUF1715-domain-containing protein [Xylaria nigripes]|nr:DUF1715-domain-containing protein [Xylaria nigripes]